MKYIKKFKEIPKKIKCICGWEWESKDSEKSDVFVCHKCNHDNSSKYK